MKKSKKSNHRKCIASQKVKPKNELIRIVKTKDNIFLVNSESNGRGAYISKDKTLIPILLKKKLLNRAFKCQVPQEVYQKLCEVMEELDER